MSATATILMIYCVQQATGTDFGANQALAASLPEQLFGLPAITQLVNTVPNLLQNLDIARSDPDNLYITTNTSGGRGNAIWPGPGLDVESQATQSHTMHLALAFAYSQNISLWDYDSASDDDLLGSVTVLESERGLGEVVKLAKSTVEGSFYYVVYRVE